jgi:hypothetical protein
MTPVDDARHHDVVEITQHLREGVRLLRHAEREPGGHVTRVDGRHDAPVADGLAIVRDPIGHSVQLLAQRVGRHVAQRSQRTIRINHRRSSVSVTGHVGRARTSPHGRDDDWLTYILPIATAVAQCIDDLPTCIRPKRGAAPLHSR